MSYLRRVRWCRGWGRGTSYASYSTFRYRHLPLLTADSSYRANIYIVNCVHQKFHTAARLHMVFKLDTGIYLRNLSLSSSHHSNFPLRVATSLGPAAVL
jgi:hypothetical protein